MYHTSFLFIVNVHFIQIFYSLSTNLSFSYHQSIIYLNLFLISVRKKMLVFRVNWNSIQEGKSYKGLIPQIEQMLLDYSAMV